MKVACCHGGRRGGGTTNARKVCSRQSERGSPRVWAASEKAGGHYLGSSQRTGFVVVVDGSLGVRLRGGLRRSLGQPVTRIEHASREGAPSFAFFHPTRQLLIRRSLHHHAAEKLPGISSSAEARICATSCTRPPECPPSPSGHHDPRPLLSGLHLQPPWRAQSSQSR